MNSSFLELFREDAGNYYTNMVEIEGGTDRLPHAFLPELKDNIRFGAKMIAMDQSPTDVTIHYQTCRRTFSGDGRLRHHHRPVPRAAPRGSAPAVLACAKNRAIRQLAL
ncbi:MAG: hypothetical protein M0C28_29700 [Candidatus Moduliflexus flocculans]|nr:hypothetical protein [Candidatus Moduliflexus flocculans]